MSVKRNASNKISLMKEKRGSSRDSNPNDEISVAMIDQSRTPCFHCNFRALVSVPMK